MAVPSPPEVPPLSSCTAPATRRPPSTRFFEGHAARTAARCSKELFPAPSSKRWPTRLPSLSTNCLPCGNGRSGRTRRVASCAACPGSDRRSERFTLSSATETPARVAAERRAVSSPARGTSAAPAESARHGGRPGSLLRASLARFSMISATDARAPSICRRGDRPTRSFGRS
jgi:hypothetical protein